MESDSESRSNSSIILKSTSTSDATSESKESHSEDEVTEIGKSQSKRTASEDECEIMEVDTNENSKTEDGELHNGGDEHVKMENNDAELSVNNEEIARESHSNPHSTADISQSDKKEDQNISEDKVIDLDPEPDVSTSAVTETDNISENNKQSTESSGQQDDSAKMDAETSESGNLADVHEDGDTSKKSSQDTSEPQSSHNTSSDSVEIVDDKEEAKLEVRLQDSEAAGLEDSEPDDKSNQKEKGIGIDAIAKKLGLQVQVSSEESKETPEEVVEDLSSTDKKPEEDTKENDTSEPKTKDASSGKSETKEKKKSKKNRTCEECSATKKLKFQVPFQGKMRYLCSEVCFKNFKEKQKPKKSSTPPPPAVPDTCAQCKKTIKDGKGFFPMVGAIKPLCSVDCLITYQEYNIPKKKCSQCKVVMEDELNTLTWETMEFCNEECLGKFQSFLGSHCTCCQSPVQQTSLGKYCVCFGADIRQFCSGTCLEEFKKGLKVCSFCQKDLSAGPDGFLAPVGEKGQFKDFCSQPCMERYEIMNTKNNAPPETEACACCKKMGIYKIHVTHGDKTAALCCDNCIAGYRYQQKIMLKVCETCYKLFEPENEDEEFQLQFEGINKFYCSKACMTLFVLSNRKIIPCSWCKVKKYNFDMIEKLDSSHQMQTYCSLNCISLFRVSLSATSAKSIRCDHCGKTLPAQFHLTMSDGSIRNFCTYQCVAQFQNQFTNAPSLTTSTSTTRQNSTTTQSQVTKTTASSSSLTPVISSVVSLATAPRSPSVGLAKIVNPQKLLTPSRTASSAITILATKSPSHTSTTSSNATTVTSSLSGGTQIIREVIVKPPQPRSLKNKAVLCKPIMLTKGISCKPHPCHKAVQTDEGPVPCIVPIPVPVYVPTPIHMFSRPVPCPVPFPVPIPVPIFIPLSKESPTQVIKQLKDMQEKIPSNPFEAELLMMAEMVADNDDDKTEKDPAVEDSNEKETAQIDPLPISDLAEDLLDIEAELPSGIAPVLQKESETLLEGDGEVSSTDGRPLQRKRCASGRGRGRGKRPRVDIITTEEADNYPSMPHLDDQNSTHQTESSDTTLRLKHMFGVNAWKHWVLQKNVQLEKGSQSARRFKLFKTDLLQLPHDELNYSLCLFVKEVRKPSGDEYAPASIYYLCLGIQQYLFENGRIDNIFTDPYYEKFTDCLNDILLNQVQLMTAEGFLISRIEEEILWESKQLGAHSPHVLLNTLMYFNTKFFNLKAIDDQMSLSFSHVTKHWKKTSIKSGPRNVVLRYFPPYDPENEDPEYHRRHKEDNSIYEQNENLENPLRCPVKLYEFYLSKCPESIKSRNDVFYLYPERSCVPDSPVWYSTQSLARDLVAKMMQRIKAVREIYET